MPYHARQFRPADLLHPIQPPEVGQEGPEDDDDNPSSTSSIATPLQATPRTVRRSGSSRSPRWNAIRRRGRRFAASRSRLQELRLEALAVDPEGKIPTVASVRTVPAWSDLRAGLARRQRLQGRPRPRPGSPASRSWR